MSVTTAMPCSSCGKPTREENVFVTIWLGAELNLIDDVPAHVCDSCGLQFYAPDVEAKIRSLISEGFPTHKASHRISVPVFRLDGGSLAVDDPFIAARQFQDRQESAQS